MKVPSRPMRRWVNDNWQKRCRGGDRRWRWRIRTVIWISPKYCPQRIRCNARTDLHVLSQAGYCEPGLDGKHRCANQEKMVKGFYHSCAPVRWDCVVVFLWMQSGTGFKLSLVFVTRNTLAVGKGREGFSSNNRNHYGAAHILKTRSGISASNSGKSTSRVREQQIRKTSRV